MKLNRRELVAGAAVLAASLGSAQAQAAEEIVIGAVFPMSGSTAQTGVDARNAIANFTDNADVGFAGQDAFDCANFFFKFEDNIAHG